MKKKKKDLEVFCTFQIEPEHRDIFNQTFDNLRKMKTLSNKIYDSKKKFINLVGKINSF